MMQNNRENPTEAKHSSEQIQNTRPELRVLLTEVVYPLTKEDKYKDALVALNDFYEKYGDYAHNHAFWQFFTYRGHCYYNLKLYKEAILDLNRAEELNIESYYTYFIRGESRVMLQDYEWALSDFQECLFLDPKKYSIYIKIGEVKDRLKKYHHAIMAFQKALSKKEELSADNISFAYFALAEIYFYNFRDYKKAEYYYRLANEIESDDDLIIERLNETKDLAKNIPGTNP